MEEVIEQTGGSLWLALVNPVVGMGRLLTRVFGCWHSEMSLPFSRGKVTYRTCIACGARRCFDLD
jgi:hypothetical protein